MSIHDRYGPWSPPPEFRLTRSGQYVGEQCPLCEGELRLIREGPGRQRRQVLRCHCGWEEPTTDWVPRMRRCQDWWCQWWPSLPQTGPRPGGPPVDDPDIWDLCGAGMLAGVDALTRASEDELTAWLDATQEPGDLRLDVEPMFDELDAWSWLARRWPMLTEREAFVLHALFWEGWGLERTGAALDLSRERIRQIGARGIRRLRGAEKSMDRPGEAKLELDERLTAACRHLCPFHRMVRFRYDPSGPDGKGRNRLRLEAQEPRIPERCLLRPLDLRGLWVLVERPHHAEPTAYGQCDHAGKYTGCKRRFAAETGHPGVQTTVRIDRDGKPWLLNRRDRGWGEYGFPLRSMDRAAEILAGAQHLRWLRDDGQGECVEVTR